MLLRLAYESIKELISLISKSGIWGIPRFFVYISILQSVTLLLNRLHFSHCEARFVAQVWVGLNAGDDGLAKNVIPSERSERWESVTLSTEYK